ncbi:MAG: 16S rRNA (cytidine(1402)-2'-O)-methyltransferase [Clostridia bacterium]|nr:16S rRNA (cytidine(1402)-2'-O)-methyltransferase [Clostridia bacterium]
MVFEKGTLYIVGTPIGNLSDLSPRAVEVFENADFIAAEDTRVTMKLLNSVGVKKPLVSYYEHNEATRSGEIVERLKAGEICALVSDAGMPLISDPGGEIVALCVKEDVPVRVVPGPSAVISALAVSGLETGRFAFEGFLSVNAKRRREHLDEVKNDRRTLVFYEAPHKLRRTLADMLAVFGDRRIALCRELTKLHEETVRTTLSEACAYFEETPPRGEFVLVVEGAKDRAEPDSADAEAVMRELLASGMSRSAAAKETAKRTGLSRGEAYKLCAGE